MGLAIPWTSMDSSGLNRPPVLSDLNSKTSLVDSVGRSSVCMAFRRLISRGASAETRKTTEGRYRAPNVENRLLVSPTAVRNWNDGRDSVPNRVQTARIVAAPKSLAAACSTVELLRNGPPEF
jgi:hypothetical protein